METYKTIKNLRERLGISQEAIAEKINLSQVTYSKIETGKRPIRESELAKIADFFNVSTDYLLGRTNFQTDTEKQADYERMAQMFLQKHNGDLQSAIKELMDELEKRNK